MLQGDEQSHGDTVEIASAPIIHPGWDGEAGPASHQPAPPDHPRPPDPPAATPSAPTVPFKAESGPAYGPLVGEDGLRFGWLKLAAIPVFVIAVGIAGYFAFASRGDTPTETAADDAADNGDRSDVLILDSDDREANGGVFRPTTTAAAPLTTTTDRANATTASSTTSARSGSTAAQANADTERTTTSDATASSTSASVSSSAPATSVAPNASSSSTAQSATSNSVASTTTSASTTTTTRATTTTTRPSSTTSIVRTQVGLGGFENGPQAASGAWVNHSAGDEVGPWSVLAPLSRDHASVHGGNGTSGHHLNLGDSGSLERDVTGLVPGTEYQLFFNAAAHHSIGGGQSALARVEIDLAAASFSVSTPSDTSFEQRSVRFTASRETVTLRFSSRGTPQACCGMILDNVIVKPI